jgi:hypothetical protein
LNKQQEKAQGFEQEAAKAEDNAQKSSRKCDKRRIVRSSRTSRLLDF